MSSSSSSSWLPPVLLSTSCWALSDICCDHLIDASGHTMNGEGDAKVALSSPPKPSVSPEFMALVGAVLSLASGLAGLALLPLPEVPSLEGLATLAGVLHFLSYYCLLRAYSEIPSTVITPLLQLSALLMLPLHAITGTKPISPLTIMATVVTTVGGLLPAVRGDITLLVQPGFWCGDRGMGVSLCILSEVLSVAYNILMHFCTHTSATSGYPSVEDSLLSSAFAAYSRCGNGLCALSLVLMVPSIRYGMVGPRAERRLMLVQDATAKSPSLRRVRVRLGFKCLAGALLSQGL
ncbi:hypothetical protein FOZ63_004516, partial [Perkinsus olseni]